MWAGVYLVVTSATDAKTGNVALIINSATSGRSGFVRLGPAPFPEHSGPLYNFDNDTHMDGRWWYQVED